jgi:hypothetical protein
MKSWWFSGMFYCVLFGVLYDDIMLFFGPTIAPLARSPRWGET